MKIKVIVGMVLSTLLVISFQNCGSHHEVLEQVDLSSIGGSTSGGNGNGDTSVEAFEKTLYPLIRLNCGDCHGSNQSPRFAVQDAQTGHDTLFSNGLISLDSPGSSRLVDKIRDGHKGYSGALADQLQSAIASWGDQ